MTEFQYRCFVGLLVVGAVSVARTIFIDRFPTDLAIEIQHGPAPNRGRY